MTGSSDARGLAIASYTLTVSGDPRFRETIHALAAKTAESVGAAPAEAVRMADALRTLIDLVTRRVASAAAPDVMHVRFEVEADCLRVELTCDTPSGTRGEGGFTFERSLAEEGRLDAFRALAPDAEFGAADSHHRCRFSCTPAQRS